MTKQIGLLALTFLVLLTLAGCDLSSTDLPTTQAISTTEPGATIPATTVDTTTVIELDYSDFPELIIGNVADQLLMPETDYYIYYFGSVCGYCSEIKQTVLAKIDSLSVDKVYIVIVDSTQDIHDDIDVTGVPAMVHIVDHQVATIHQNKTNVLAVLEELE